MSLLVVAIPDLAPADQHWINTFRAHHDPAAQRIAPHVTLVFPTSSITADALADHVANIAASTVPFTVMLCAALPMPDITSTLHHLFLVPDQGNSPLIRLHDALYRGPLASSLRLDIPFIPHMTIGAFEDAHICAQHAAELNHTPFAVTAPINTLAVIEAHNNDPVELIAEYHLNG